MELCKWTIDLGALPSFQQNASVPNSNGFYTGASVASFCTWIVTAGARRERAKKGEPAQAAVCRQSEYLIGLLDGRLAGREVR